MSAFDELAEYGASKLPGIDWDALEAKGKPGIYHTDYFQDYMLPAWDYVDGIRDSLLLSNAADTAAIMAGFTSASKPVIRSAKGMVEALVRNSPDVAAELGVRMTVEELRATITAMYYSALDGMILHRYGVLQSAHRYGVLFTDEEIADHAERTTRTLRAIAALDKLGVLSIIRKPGLSGPEELVIGGWTLFTAVVIAAVIAAAMVYITVIVATNARAFMICRQAQATGDKENWDACVKRALDDAHEVGEAPFKMWDSVLKYVAAGAAIYLGITFLPEIVTSLKKARTASRAT